MYAQLDPRSRDIKSRRWCDSILTRWCDSTPGNYICRAVDIGRRNITLVSSVQSFNLLGSVKVLVSKDAGA